MLFHLVPLFGYMLGTALHTLIAALIMARRQKRPSEKVFLFLVISVGVWHAGNLVALVLLRFTSGEWIFLAQLAKSIAFLGLAAFPALLVHTHVAFLRETDTAPDWTKHNILLGIMYSPLLYFLGPLYRMFLNQDAFPIEVLAQYMLPYTCWFVTSLIDHIRYGKMRLYDIGTALIGGFGFIALVLAAVGLYGVMAFLVNQRKHEIGIRLALGATSGDVLKSVVINGMKKTLLGLVIGVPLAIYATKSVQYLLVGVSLKDPLVLSLAALFLSAITLIAALGPGWKATRVDPLIALRSE